MGDRRYPFIAILEGEVAIQDAGGNEIVRHGAGGFLGELNLLSGQTVFLTAVVRQPLRYIAVEREALRALLFEDGPLSDLLLYTFIPRREALQTVQGIGLEIVGPHSSEDTMRMLDFARSNRLPFTWHDEPGGDGKAPLVRLPGGVELQSPSTGQVLRALGIGLELAPREEVDLLVVGGGPAGLGAAVYGASEGLSTLVVESTALGGQAGASRRIENYLGFPAGISGTELTSRAVTQARKFNARTATPYRAVSLDRATDATWCSWTRARGACANGVDRDRSPIPTASGGGAVCLRGAEHLLRSRPAGVAALRSLTGRRCRWRQLGRSGRRLARAGRRARHAPPPPR